MGFIRGTACANFPRVSQAQEFFEDFLTDEGLTGWTATQNDGSGSGTGAATAVADAVNGVVTIATNTASGADGEWSQIQQEAETFKLGLGAKIRFACRLKLDDVTQSEFFAGLCITDTAAIGDSGAGDNVMTDFIGFTSDDGDAFLDLVWDLNGTARASYNRAAALATMVDDTWMELAFEIVMDPVTAGTGVVRAWLDGKPLVLTGGSYDYYSTDMPYDEELCVLLAVANGNTSTRTLSVDVVEATANRAS